MRLTTSIRKEDVRKNWYVIDAKDLILGRLASFIAMRIRGKHKPHFTPHVDCGDRVVVINAQKVHLTGSKLKNKKFYWHTGYPGGIKERVIGQILDSKHPERVLIKAVERMITRNTLGRMQMKNLYVYGGEEHPHSAQNPEKIEFADLNTKNKAKE